MYIKISNKCGDVSSYSNAVVSRQAFDRYCSVTVHLPFVNSSV
jgi:hypothetical protein